MKSFLILVLFALCGAVISEEEFAQDDHFEDASDDLEEGSEEHDLEDDSEEHDLEDDLEDLELADPGYYPKKKCHFKKVCKPQKRCYEKGYRTCKPKKVCNKYIVRYARTCKKVCKKSYGYGHTKCRKVCRHNKPIWKFGCRYFRNNCQRKVYCKKVVQCIRKKICTKRSYY